MALSARFSVLSDFRWRQRRTSKKRWKRSKQRRAVNSGALPPSSAQGTSRFGAEAVCIRIGRGRHCHN
jgi:hypothetical protein